MSTAPIVKVVAILTVVTFVVGAATAKQKVLQLRREVVYLIVLLGQLSLAAVFSPVWRGGAVLLIINEISKTMLMCVLIMFVASTLQRIRRLILIQTLSAVVIAAASAALSVKEGGGRLTGIVGGIYGNPNDLAFIAALALPLCFAFLLETPGFTSKTLWAAAMIVLTGSILLTYSRSGLLALLVGAFICIWEFGLKGRRPLLVFLSVLIGLVIVLIVAPAKYGARVKTILEPDEDPTGSAQGRKHLLVRSLEVTAEHPLLGIGPGDFEVISGNWHATHNSYTQMSAEGGVPALILFIMILQCSFANIRQARRRANGRQMLLLTSGLRASLGAFVIGSFFSSVAYLFFPYFLIGYASALRRYADECDPSQLKPGKRGGKARFPWKDEAQQEKPELAPV
jgi:O-antigen ligase